eukprot:6979354-Pyramimonas_sp.AAC.1
MATVMKEKTEVRQFQLKIKGSTAPYAKYMCKTLVQFNEKQDGLYAIFTGATKGEGKDADITRAINVSKARTAWFDQNVRKLARSLASSQ